VIVLLDLGQTSVVAGSSPGRAPERRAPELVDG
jgi:hypothetical protein